MMSELDVSTFSARGAEQAVATTRRGRKKYARVVMCGARCLAPLCRRESAPEHLRERSSETARRQITPDERADEASKAANLMNFVGRASRQSSFFT